MNSSVDKFCWPDSIHEFTWDHASILALATVAHIVIVALVWLEILVETVPLVRTLPSGTWSTIAHSAVRFASCWKRDALTGATKIVVMKFDPNVKPCLLETRDLGDQYLFLADSRCSMLINETKNSLSLWTLDEAAP